MEKGPAPLEGHSPTHVIGNSASQMLLVEHARSRLQNSSVHLDQNNVLEFLFTLTLTRQRRHHECAETSEGIYSADYGRVAGSATLTDMRLRNIRSSLNRRSTVSPMPLESSTSTTRAM